MKTFYSLTLFVIIGLNEVTAESYFFYITSFDEFLEVDLKLNGEYLLYNGREECLKKLFDENNIMMFEKAFPASEDLTLKRAWQIETETKDLGMTLLSSCGHLFDFTEEFYSSELSFYPNDYGTTSPITNLGAPLSLSAYDFLRVPEAWNISTGHSNIRIAIADTRPIPNLDINDKIEYSVNAPSTSFFAVHGTTSAEYSAGRMNNAYGLSGICADCDLYSMNYAATSTYNEMIAISQQEKFIINCSWWSSRGVPILMHQLAVREVTNNGSIIVAAAHNDSWEVNPGTLEYYPASYEEVISVSSVGHNTELRDNVMTLPNGVYYNRSVKDMVCGSIGFENNDPVNGEAISFTAGTTTFNTFVDILAPGYDVPIFGDYVLSGTIINGVSATSTAAPQVSGTIGLILSVNNCLEYQEVRSILQLSSRYIGNISANSLFLGNFGSGSMNSFKAVEMANQMNLSNGNVVVENQIFERWYFPLKSSPFEITVRNQIFKDAAVVDFQAKSAIYLEPGVELNPSTSGYAEFLVDSNLSCGFPIKSGRFSNNQVNDNQQEVLEMKVSLSPNPVKTTTKVLSSSEIISYEIYSVDGVLIQSTTNLNAIKEFNLDLEDLSTGLYILNTISTEGLKSSCKFLKE